jgi:hypothetical protein
MHVAILERGQQNVSIEVYDLRLRAKEFPNIVVRAHCDELFASNCRGLGASPIRTHRYDCAIDEGKVCRMRTNMPTVHGTDTLVSWGYPDSPVFRTDAIPLVRLPSWWFTLAWADISGTSRMHRR